MMKKLIIVLFISLSMPLLQLHAKIDRAVVATGLSVLLPGGGQLFNKKYTKALFICGAETATAYYILKFNKEIKEVNDEHKKEKYNNYRNNLIWLIGGEVAYSAIDAFIDAKMADMNNKVHLSIKKGGVYICYKF